ncbi:helix-turn-helix domain-containing protein [Nesterenkonia suensis]
MSGTDDRLIDEVIAAHEAVAAAEQEVTEKVAERAMVVQSALDRGAGSQAIADALGVDRSRVYRLAKPQQRR